MGIKRLKLARINADLKQIDLAQKVNLSESSISKYETGRARPSLISLSRISRALGVSIEDLLLDYIDTREEKK